MCELGISVQLVIGFAFVSGLMVLGRWLETINGKHGIMDEFLTPLPLGVAGMLVLLERSFA
jgi:hypothetical protein